MNRVRNRPLWRNAARGVVTFMVVGIVVLPFPSAYPNILLRTLEKISPLLDDNTALLEVSMKGTEGDFKIENGKLQSFHDLQGQPFPVVNMDYQFDLGVMNTYPLIVFALLACMPMDFRRRLVLLALGFVGIFVIGMVDLAIIWNWMGMEGTSMVIKTGGFHIPATEANLAVSHEVIESIKRTTLAKSFLSAGGRQFFSVLLAGLCLLAVYPRRSDATGDGTP